MSVDQYQWEYILCLHTKRCICNTNLVKVPRIEESWSPTSATAQHLTVLLFVCFSCATALVLFTAVCQHVHGSHSYLNKITTPECYSKIWFSLWAPGWPSAVITTRRGITLSSTCAWGMKYHVLATRYCAGVGSSIPPQIFLTDNIQKIPQYTWRPSLWGWFDPRDVLLEILTLPQLWIDPDTWLDNVVH